MTVLAATLFDYRLAIYGLPLLALGVGAWVLRRRHGRLGHLRQWPGLHPMLLWLRRAASVRPLVVLWELGRRKVPWAVRQITRRHVRLPLLAVAVALLLIALCVTIARQRESSSDVVFPLVSTEKLDGVAQEATAVEQVAEYHWEPAARDQCSSQRRRVGATVLGGLVVLTVLALAPGRRINA